MMIYLAILPYPQSSLLGLIFISVDSPKTGNLMMANQRIT